MYMDGASVLLYCPTFYCELSFSGFLSSTLPIGINVNHWYADTITMYKMKLSAFSRAELWIIFISY